MPRPKTTDPTDHQADTPPPVPRGELMIPSRISNSSLIPAQDTQLAACPCNFDQSTREGRMLAFNAVSVSDIEMSDHEEVTHSVHYWLVHWRTTTDEETGEESSYPVLTLISPDGEVLSLTSEVALHRWADLIDMEGKGPWEPPLVVVIRCRKSRKTKRTWHELRRAT